MPFWMMSISLIKMPTIVKNLKSHQESIDWWLTEKKNKHKTEKVSKMWFE